MARNVHDYAGLAAPLLAGGWRFGNSFFVLSSLPLDPFFDAGEEVEGEMMNEKDIGISFMHPSGDHVHCNVVFSRDRETFLFEKMDHAFCYII